MSVDLVVAEALCRVKQVLSGSGLAMAVEEGRCMIRIDVADAGLTVVHMLRAAVHMPVMAKAGCWMLLPCLLLVARGSRRPMALLLCFWSNYDCRAIDTQNVRANGLSSAPRGCR